MRAYMHLASDADDFVKRMADGTGRIPIHEHYPEALIEGEDAYLLDFSRLDKQQRIELVTHIAVREDISVAAAQERCRFGIPVGRSQGEEIEVMGELFPIDEEIYVVGDPGPFQIDDIEPLDQAG